MILAGRQCEAEPDSRCGPDWSGPAPKPPGPDVQLHQPRRLHHSPTELHERGEHSTHHQRDARPRHEGLHYTCVSL